MNLRHNADLQNHNTFALPVRAAALCTLTDERQLIRSPAPLAASPNIFSINALVKGNTICAALAPMANPLPTTIFCRPYRRKTAAIAAYCGKRPYRKRTMWFKYD